MKPMNPIAIPDTRAGRRTTLRAARVGALVALGSLSGLVLDLLRLRGAMSDGTSVALAAAVTVLLATCVVRVLAPTAHDEASHAAEGGPR